MPTQSYNDIERNTAASNIPLYTHVELTDKCNLNCIHCYMTPKSGQPELTTDKFKNVFDQLADLGTLYLSLTGGEIFLRPDFFELAGYARQQGFALRLFTNATLITREIAKQIAELRPLLMEISIPRITPAVHDGITTVPGSLENTLEALHYLRGHDIRLLLKTSAMSVNKHELKEIQSFAESIHAEFRADAMISPKLDASKTPLDYRLNDDDLKWFLREINPEWTSHTPAPDAPVCNAAKGMLANSPYGDVFPCLRVQ